jgi:hypothetical protein
LTGPKVGAFGTLHENRGVQEYDRTDIVQVASKERHVRFVFPDAKELDFFAEWSERYLSNQRRFFARRAALAGCAVAGQRANACSGLASGRQRRGLRSLTSLRNTLPLRTVFGWPGRPRYHLRCSWAVLFAASVTVDV